MEDLSSHLFWDVNASTISIEKHQSWLVKRVLEMGTWDDWNILRKLLSKEQLVESVKSLRSIDKRAASYACVALGLEKNELRCYTENQSLSTHWNY